MLAPGGENHYRDFIPEHFRRRVGKVKEQTGVEVLGVVTPGVLDNLNAEILSIIKLTFMMDTYALCQKN